MKLLRWFVILLVVGWLVAEVAVDRFAEARISDQVAERTEDVVGVRTEIDSFPPMVRLAFSGSVAKITVTLEEVARQNFTFGEFRFEIFGLDMDRFALFSGEVKVTDFDRGVLTVVIGQDQLSRFVGDLTGVNVRVSGRILFVGSSIIRLPEDLIPCEPEARIEEGQLIASCTFTEIPETIFEEAEGFG